MAVGVLLVIVGLWLFINGINGNLSGVITGKTAFNPDVTKPQPTGLPTSTPFSPVIK